MNINYKFLKDAEIITNLSKIVYDDHNNYYPDMFNDFIFKDRLKLYEDILKKDSNFSIIAFDNEKPVGYILAIEHKFPSTIFKKELLTYFIDSMSIVQDYQRKGIGTELINQVKIFAKTKNINRLNLYVWDLNIKGIKFYSKLGFK
jgi:GNAT superfamily N-acetyltransferase